MSQIIQPSIKARNAQSPAQWMSDNSPAIYPWERKIPNEVRVANERTPRPVQL